MSLGRGFHSPEYEFFLAANKDRMQASMCIACQVRKVLSSGVVGLTAEGEQIGRNGRLSLIQVTVIIHTSLL